MSYCPIFHTRPARERDAITRQGVRSCSANFGGMLYNRGGL
jgi:hypothetical protein